MPDVRTWLSQQSPATQKAITALRRSIESAPHLQIRERLHRAAAYRSPQPQSRTPSIDDFLTALASTRLLIKPRLVSPLYDFWSCVPSRLAIEVAVSCCDTTKALQAFQIVAEKALLDAEDVTAFEADCRVDDPLDEVTSWLRNRIARHAANAC